MKAVEAQIEYLKFLKRQGNLRAASLLGRQLLDKVETEQSISTTLWVQAHIEIAKLESANGSLDQAVQLLNKLRQVLPPIDVA
jgi:hypothetical protein